MSQPINPTVQMFNNYVLVRIDESDEKTEGGLYMPTTKGERTEAVALKAVVVAIPEDALAEESTMALVDMKPGDIIFCSKWELHAVRIGTEKYATVRAKDIMFKLG